MLINHSSLLVFYVFAVLYLYLYQEHNMKTVAINSLSEFKPAHMHFIS